MTPRRFAHWWLNLWSEPAASEQYGLLRVALGLLCIGDLLGATPLALFWEPTGLVPIPAGDWGPRDWVFSTPYGALIGRALFFACLLAYVCLTVGVGGPGMVAVGFASNVLQSAWNVLPYSAAHQVLTVFLFCLVFADCHQSLSLWPTSPLRPTQPQGPLLLFRWQVCLIYLASGLTKLANEPWRNGSAVYYALNHNLYQRFAVDGVSPSLVPLTTLATFGTVAFEIGFPLLILWPRTRSLALLAGVSMHLGVWAFLEVGPFSWVMIASYIAFLSPSTVQSAAAAVRRARGHVISATRAKHVV